MVFASLVFLFIFLPLNLILYYSSSNKTYRNVVLIFFSFFFYAWGEPVWIVLMIISASVDYINGLVIERNRGTPWAKVGLISSLVVNLGLLGIFKYSGFLYQTLNDVFGLSLSVPSFTLPIGISFYTFQTISYTVDVYRNEVKAQHSFLKFFMFVSLYHQLVAGPIVRYSHIAHEIDNRVVNLKDISSGVNRFCVGLFKKVFFANVAGEMVAQYLEGDLSLLSVGEAWWALLLFSFQIYFDFSGYSDMAIGLGRMFGFHYHENFNYPYIAKSATDFWRRWHISLGTFFRDYLYIPLGGNKTNIYRNLLVVWFLTGLWHGASWNFVIWGLYFGVLIAIEKLFLTQFFSRVPIFFSHVYLLFAALMGWAIFYFTDMSRLGSFFGLLFGQSEAPGWKIELTIQLQNYSFWLFAVVLACMPVVPFITKQLLAKNVLRQPHYELTLAVINIGLVIVSTAFLIGKSYNPFLYFRF